MNPRQVLITGSRGQVGTWLRRTAPDGVAVSEIDLKPPSGIDVRSPEARRMASQCDAAIHAAARISVTESIADPESTMDVNVEGTRNLLAGMRPGSHFVFISSAAVYGDCPELPIRENAPLNPLSPYGESKKIAEDLVAQFAAEGRFTYTIVRPFNIYSSLQDPRNSYSGVISVFLSRAASGQQLVIHGTGEQTRDFVHAKDVADLLWTCARGGLSAGHVFNACTGTPTSIMALAQACQRLASSDLPMKHDSPRPGDIVHSLGSPASARALLGWEARMDLQAGLQETFGKPAARRT